jgi:hypothetical protein
MFEFKGQLSDDLSIADELANFKTLNLSDSITLIDGLVTDPTPIFHTSDLSDSQTFDEEISKFGIFAGFLDSEELADEKAFEVKKYLLDSQSIADSSKRYPYSYRMMKWQAACCNGGI